MDEFELGETDFQTMLRLTEQQRCAADIGRKIDRDRSTVSRSLNKLEDKGLVRKTVESRSKFYELTGSGYQCLIRWVNSNETGNSMAFRHHKITIKIPVKRGQNKIAREEKENISEMKNWKRVDSSIDSEQFGEVHYTINHKHLIVSIPESYYPATFDGLANALLEAYNKAYKVKKELESEYGSLELGNASDVEISDQHLALENEPIAKILSAIGVEGKLEKTENYTVRVDRSKGEPELEFEGSKGHRRAQLFLENVLFLTKKSLSQLDNTLARPN